MALRKSTICVAVFASFVNAITNPIKVAYSNVIGNQSSNNYPGVSRDGGWESILGSTYYQYYLDTSSCAVNQPGVNCHGFSGNTLAQTTSDPRVVHDVPGPDSNGNPGTLCSPGQDAQNNGYRLHLTNIIPIPGSSTQGVAWFYNVSSPSGDGNIDGDTVGTGVATITMTGYGPICSATPQFWGPGEPAWGDHGALTISTDKYVYIYGGLNSDPQNTGDVYLARVLPGSATTLSAYQYWNGTAFQANRLYNPIYNGYAPASVMQNTITGSVFYSAYYKLYLYLTSDNKGSILAKAASYVQGPWSAPTLISNFSGYALPYDTCAQTHFDKTGKTLISTWVNFYQNSGEIYVLNTTFV